MTLKGVTNQFQIFIMHVASVPEFIFLFYVQYVLWLAESLNMWDSAKTPPPGATAQ